MIKKYKINFYLFILAFLFFELKANDQKDSLENWSESIAQTLNLISSKCYYPFSLEKSIIKALDSFVAFDNYSHFLGPKDYKELIKTTNGEFFGIGTILAPKKKDDDHVLILDVAIDSPAEKKGLKKFDKIIAIDNIPISKLAMNEVVGKLRGEKQYSAVTLTILRNKKEIFKVTLHRDVVKETNVKAYYFNAQKIIYCSLALFSDQVSKELRQILERYVSKGIKGVILDVRDNAGGLLNAAVECASLILPKDSLIVSTKNKSQNILEQFRTKNEPVINNKIPIVFILNNFTASAAEILPGACKYYASKSENLGSAYNPYIFTIGTCTYGKGSVQEVIPVGNDCALRITTSLYYLSDGNPIDRKGIYPDFSIEQKFGVPKETKIINKLYGKERAMEETNSKTEKSEKQKLADAKVKALKLLKRDFQIQSALNLLNILNLGFQITPENVNTYTKALKFLKQNFINENDLNPIEIGNF